MRGGVRVVPPRPPSGGVTAPARTAKQPMPALGQKQKVPAPIKGGTQPIVAAGNANAGGDATPATNGWDTQYTLASGGANKVYGDTMANLGASRALLGQEYGLPYVDPATGQVVNPADAPHSRAAMLKKSYLNSVRGSTNSMAARGQLYAGSLANAQQANRFGYDSGYDSLSKDFQGNLNRLGKEEVDALGTKEDTINEAGWKRLEALQSAPLEPAPVGGGSGPGAYARSKKYPRHGVARNRRA